MKYRQLLVLIVLMYFLGACATLQKEDYLHQYGSKGGRGQGFRVQPYQEAQEDRSYKPGEISGRITRLRVESISPDMEPLLAAEVQTPNCDLIHVHLGPAGILDIHESDLKPGDEVTIKASNYKLGGQNRLVASEITHNCDTTKLPDLQDIPYWKICRKKKVDKANP